MFIIRTITKCNDTIKISQELTKSNTKLFAEKTISKVDQIEETATPAYKDESIESNETLCERVNRKTEKLERKKTGINPKLDKSDKSKGDNIVERK